MSGLKERRRRRSDEEEDEARLDAFDGSLSVSLSSSSSFLFALSSAPFLLLLYFCHVEPIKPKVSPRLARKGAEQKQQQQKRKRERMRRCCFFSLPFSLRSIDRGGRRRKKLLLLPFFPCFLPHQKQDLGVLVVEAERVEDRVDPVVVHVCMWMRKGEGAVRGKGKERIDGIERRRRCPFALRSFRGLLPALSDGKRKRTS